MDFRLSTATLVSVKGELDLSTAEELTEPTRLAVNADCPLILDLSACTFVDSTGLRFVLHAHTALADSGRAMAVVTDDPHVRELFSLTAIDLTVPVFTNLDEAIEWLGAGTEEAVPPQWWIAASTTGGPSLAFPAR
jgi:anti-sigma B factor antagonist